MTSAPDEVYLSSGFHSSQEALVAFDSEGKCSGNALFARLLECSQMIFEHVGQPAQIKFQNFPMQSVNMPATPFRSKNL